MSCDGFASMGLVSPGSPTSPPASPRDAFGRDAANALSALKLALGEVLQALPVQATTAAELAKVLGLNRKIGWQVWRMADPEDHSPLQVLPGPVALEGFLQACGREGVAVPLLDGVRAAIRRFDDLAELHGGDRASLMSLLRQAGPAAGEGLGDRGAAERAAESVRRRAYLANGEIWGIQTHAYFATALLAPGSIEGRVDDLSLTGEIGVRRLRPDAVRVISGMGFQTGAKPDGTVVAGGVVARPLVKVDPSSGMIEPMLPRFSSARVRAIANEAEPGQTRIELVESPVGRRGEVDFVLGQYCPNVGRRFATETLKRVHFTVHLYSAYAVCVHDLLVRRDLWADATARSRVYSGLRGMMTSQARRDERDVLPIRAEVQKLGAGLSVLKTPHVPNYLEIIDWACQRVGWKPEQFDAYRCVLMYPPMPCSLVMGVDLPERA